GAALVGPTRDFEGGAPMRPGVHRKPPKRPPKVAPAPTEAAPGADRWCGICFGRGCVRVLPVGFADIEARPLVVWAVRVPATVRLSLVRRSDGAVEELECPACTTTEPTKFEGRTLVHQGWS